MKNLDSSYYLIEQYLKFKHLDFNSSPIFTAKLSLPNFCFKYETIKLDSNSNLLSEVDILNNFKKFNSLSLKLSLSNSITVINPYINGHNKIYSMKKPPKFLLGKNVSSFYNFNMALNDYPNLILSIKDNKIIISEK